MGQIAAYGAMTEGGMTGFGAFFLILLMHFILGKPHHIAAASYSRRSRRKAADAHGDADCRRTDGQR